jgi:hypothetical protein
MFVTYCLSTFLSTYMYVKVCTADVPCTSTDGYIHFINCADIIELCMYTGVSFWFQLFDLPCWVCADWPVGWVWLLQGFTSIQVQGFKHTSVVCLSLKSSCHPAPLPFLLGWVLIRLAAPPQARQRLLPHRRCCGAGPRPQCWPRPWAYFLRPLGPQICSLLSWSWPFWDNRWRPEPPWCPHSRLSGLLCNCNLKESGFILVYTSTITLSYWIRLCIDADLKIECMMRAFMWLYSFIL